jgi:peptide/nickel transport system permease protein
MMPFEPVVLPTDALVYALIVLTGLFTWYARCHEHLAAPWRRVVRSRVGMVALTILLCYVVIGFLDTLHFRTLLPEQNGKRVYAVEVLSVFDLIAGPLRTHKEKTYSAPFAARLYMEETIERPGGGKWRGYPRLEYGGAQLRDPASQRIPDIARRGLAGAAGGLVLWLLCAIALCAVRAQRAAESLHDAWRAVWRGDTTVPWNAVLITLGVIFCLSGAAVALCSHYHIFGTDKVGQDVFYLALKSIRTGLIIGTLTTMVMLPFALLLGIAAGYFGGWVDDVIQYVYTTLSSIPSVLLIAAAVLMTQVYITNHPALFSTIVARADLRLLSLCLILGITSWTSLCRLLRGEALKLRDADYIQAARAMGVSSWQIIMRHILPNVMHIVLITTVMDFSGLVLAEAVLSYIGVGVDPSTISFGTMINAARLELARDPPVWWSLAAAFFFMLLLVLSANLFADAVRDAFDPRLKPARTRKPAHLPAAAAEKEGAA